MDETDPLNVRLNTAKIRFTQSSLKHSVVTYARNSNIEEKPVFVQVTLTFYIISRAFEPCLACQQFISD